MRIYSNQLISKHILDKECLTQRQKIAFIINNLPRIKVICIPNNMTVWEWERQQDETPPKNSFLEIH
jgi:hypothetical protein